MNKVVLSCFDDSELVIQSNGDFVVVVVGGEREVGIHGCVCAYVCVLVEGRSKKEGASHVNFKISLKCGR